MIGGYNISQLYKTFVCRKVPIWSLDIDDYII